MNALLWIVQGITAGLFLLSGVIKSTRPKEQLAGRMPWVNDFSAGTVRFIGLSQLLGGLGLIVPWATGIAPFLTPAAAAGLCLVMLLAAVYHARKNEWKAVAFNAVLFSLAAVVLYGRLQQL